MSIKNNARLRRAKSTRAHIRFLGVPRLSVLRTGQHLYAQLFSADGSTVIAAANTLQADVKEGLKNGKNSDAAASQVAARNWLRWPKPAGRAPTSSRDP